jgi:chromosome partitioning protein
MKTITFFNNKGGVGKTSLVYHLAWMFADHGVKVLAVDLDPQANLTAMFLPEERLEEIWDGDEHPATILGAVRPSLKGIGDIAIPSVQRISETLAFLPGDLGLSRFEDKLSDAWPRCHNGDEDAFRKMTAFHRIMEQAAGNETDVVIIDVGPNLGAINRAALIASDYVCMPLAPDLFSQQGLRNLGPTMREWRRNWTEMLRKAPKDISKPKGNMTPLGYVIMQYGIRDSRPVKAYQRWMDRIPAVYRECVTEEPLVSVPKVDDDPYALATLKNYRSLMPLAMDAHKPMFHLKPADGAIGAHQEAVKKCRDDFLSLARKIAARTDIPFNPGSESLP